MAEPIGVGIIGGGVGRTWASAAHIPALRSLPAFELRALSTSHRSTADQAGKAFGVANAFDDYRDLIACPDVDLVVVSVKVPTHFELVSAALAAGKHVYCEWPLGNGVDEAERLALMAGMRSEKTMIGLQVQGSPQIQFVRDLISDGYIGRVLSTMLIGCGGVWGDVTDEGYAYLNDKANGATLLSIPMGHTLDGLCLVLGEFSEISAMATIRWPEVPMQHGDRLIRRTTWDHIALSGRIGDILVSAHYQGGTTQGTRFLWEITGTEGVLQLTGGDTGSVQAFAPLIRGAQGKAPLAELQTPDRYRLVPETLPEGPAYNVAQMYAMFAADLRDRTRRAPDFEHAARRHRMLRAIEKAIETGKRCAVG